MDFARVMIEGTPLTYNQLFFLRGRVRFTFVFIPAMPIYSNISAERVFGTF